MSLKALPLRILVSLILLTWIPFDHRPVLAQTPMAAPQEEVIDGRGVLLSIPQNPRAIIYLFHGTGGSASYATNIATRLVLERFAAAGYGYAATSSGQREGPARWIIEEADPRKNPDLTYMLGLHEHLVRSGAIGARTPVFSMGMSNGGGMANLFGLVSREAGLPIAGVADYLGPFPASMLGASRTGGTAPPSTFVVVAENDSLVSSQNVLAIAANLSETGVRIETHLATEAATKPGDFTRIPGVDLSRSQAIFDELVANGVIDRSGKRLMFTDQTTIPRDAEDKLSGRISERTIQRQVFRILMETWAAHMMRSDYADQQFAFFEAELARTKGR